VQAAPQLVEKHQQEAQSEREHAESHPDQAASGLRPARRRAERSDQPEAHGPHAGGLSHQRPERREVDGDDHEPPTDAEPGFQRGVDGDPEQAERECHTRAEDQRGPVDHERVERERDAPREQAGQP
jgi:hypothetical protein